MFWVEIHLQPDQQLFDRNNAHKNVTILHNFGSGSSYTCIFFSDGCTLKFSQV